MLPIPEMHRVAAELRKSSTDGSSEDEILKLFRTLSGGPGVGISRSHHQLWWRARICKSRDGYSSIYEMLYPPTGSTDYGRASLKGSRTLYAGWNRRVALDEIHAKEGDVVQLITLRVKDPIQFPCAIIGELQAVWNSGRSLINSEKIEQAIRTGIDAQDPGMFYDLFVDSLISEIFRAPILDSTQYITSAVIANHLLCSGHGGIMYPSVRSAHSINLAVASEAFDSNFEVLGSEVMEIIANHGYGLYIPKLLKQTWELETDGTFKWDSARVPPITEGRRRDTLIPPDFKGWRVKP